MQTITREVGARELRARLADVVNEAAYGRGRIAVLRYGGVVAVMIGWEDFQRFRRLETAPGAPPIGETDEEALRRMIREGGERAAQRERAEEALAAQAAAEQRVAEAHASVTRAEERAARAEARAAQAEERVAVLERGFTVVPRRTSPG